MNIAMVALRQQHYEELVKYLEQVSPKTAESIKANNVKRERKRKEIEKYQIELDEKFGLERENWEYEQNKIIEDSLKQKELEFDVEMQKQLDLLEKKLADSKIEKSMEEELVEKMKIEIAEAKSNGASQDEIDSIMKKWDAEQAKNSEKIEVSFQKIIN
jgi:hypothetical protein